MRLPLVLLPVVVALLSGGVHAKDEAFEAVKQPLAEFAKVKREQDVLVLFKADWCVTCAVLKKHLQSKEYAAMLKREKVTVALADCTVPKASAWQDLKGCDLKIRTVPAMALVTKNGRIIYARVEAATKDGFMQEVDALIGRARKHG